MTSLVITGGTGFLGTLLLRAFLPDTTLRRLCVFSRDEFKQAQLMERFGVAHNNPRIRFFLGDVRDLGRLRQAFRGVDTVIHAAALKRVDAANYNPSEVTRTNVLGTENVCVAAIEAGVQRVLLISSDKAVQPTNIYGATKLMAEQLTVYLNSLAAGATKLSVVRYGNVLGSRGSVIHRWRAQQAQGVPLEITDPTMTRFWITGEQAVALIQRALTRMHGGEIFVPKLPAACLTDVAEALAPGHPTRVVGLRDGGEKLHETLLAPHERVLDWGDDYVIPPTSHPWTALPWIGTPIAPGTYTSETAPRLTVAQIQHLLRCVP